MEGKRKDEWNIYIGHFKGLRVVRMGMILKSREKDKFELRKIRLRIHNLLFSSFSSNFISTF